jgi:hypothetical protein
MLRIGIMTHEHGDQVRHPNWLPSSWSQSLQVLERCGLVEPSDDGGHTALLLGLCHTSTASTTFLPPPFSGMVRPGAMAK